ncbi:unnamed protein product [Owenia fusiformis]|uniref:Centrosomal protein of 135 kDa n=1 Tax=Owenia fusiformis TaxID=6347 RepID=A0A8S4N8N4_OWEFU|nr:unnamed protein product [Owenia fusiformis]
MLDGGRPYDVVALEARNRANERLISQLNIQIDYLQQKNREVEHRLSEAEIYEREALDKSVNFESKARQLEDELQDVDLLASRLKTDKNAALRVADHELDEAKVELEKSRQELEDMDVQVAQLRAERDRLLNEQIDLKSNLNTKTADNQRMDDLVDKMQADKKRLSSRVNKLTSNERELVLEIERLKNKAAPKRKGGKSINRLDSFIKGLEEERDYWREEVDALQKLLRLHGPGSSPMRSRSPSRSKVSTPAGTPSKSERKTAAHYETIMRVLEDERDHYKREYELLRALRHSRPNSPVRSRSPSLREMSVADETELLRVTRERDELQSMLSKFERHMAEIQTNVKVLTNERDKVNTMYEEAKLELQRMRRDVVRSPKSPKVSLAAQAVLRRVEHERDDAIADLRRMTTERDTLREKLKIATESHLSDRARLEQKIEDLERTIQAVEAERNDLSIRIAALKDKGDRMEDHIKEQVITLGETQDDASQQKAAATQMRLLAEQAETSLMDNRRQLIAKEGDLRAVEERAAQLEVRVAELMRHGKVKDDEIVTLRGTISALDREKDALQIAVDDKAERNVDLEDTVLERDKLLSDFKINTSDLEAQINHLQETIGNKEREIRSLRRQLDSSTEELTETSRGRDVAVRENRRLQDDLGTMTRENQNLNADLDDVINEREELKAQVQDYMIEVKRVEELLAAKEQERSDLLEQYRLLTSEAETYQTQSHQLESEGSNLRLEVMTRESEIRRQREKIDSLEREIQEHMQANRAYEVQVSDLTHSVASLEERVRQLDNDKISTQQDLAAVRDLCAKVESTKDNLARQLSSKSMDNEQIQTLLDDMKREVEILRSQVGSERTNVKSLEQILQTNREKEFQTSLSSQEKNAEIQLLRDRLQLNDSKMESLNREISTLRSRNIEQDAEIDRLRRDLTNERFERERTSQQLRRLGNTPPTDSGRASRSTRISATSSRSSMSPTRRTRSPDRSYSRTSSRAENGHL